MSGYGAWKQERRRERAKWSVLKREPLYGALRLGERLGLYRVRRRVDEALESLNE